MRIGILAIAAALVLWSGGAEFSAPAAKERFERTKPHVNIGPVDHSKSASKQVGGTRPVIVGGLPNMLSPNQPATSGRPIVRKPPLFIFDEPTGVSDTPRIDGHAGLQQRDTPGDGQSPAESDGLILTDRIFVKFKDADQATSREEAIDSLMGEVPGQDARIVGFGTFSVRKREIRKD